MKNITVIGAGIMGHGIAQLFAQVGKNVRLYDTNQASLDKAKLMIQNSMKRLVEKGLLTEESFELATKKLVYSIDIEESLENAEFIVEVVPEVLTLKWETYLKIERIVSKDSIIASNTSAIPLTRLIEKTKHPERFIITHFFNPPQLVPLVEIIKSHHTDEKVIQTTFELMELIGKRPVVLQKEVPGFIANRIQLAVVREVFWLLENGVATAEDIDIVMKESLGFRYAFQGPFEGADLTGLDTANFVSESLFPVLSASKEPPEFLNKMIRAGHLGMKSGKGFYTYDGDAGIEKVRKRDEQFLELMKLRT
ncbi:3-hydroxyacyl-CoA dehydrogenase family protein [Niallia sp. Krafla_26]|uniref:3-hydroxyacyl-CoA dehydrogenase family protein n=1 Tax=Niallia sp. Krafla_26 TaxID=3064703 RepID=UPI003D16D0DF